MTEHELLEMAAKAAGILAQYSDNLGDFSIGEPYSRNERRWNPLTDDGDALRLAVKLKMDLDLDASGLGCIYVGMFSEESGQDPYEATRLVIVRAAAEIGRNMP